MGLNSTAPYQFIWQDTSQSSYLNRILTLSSLEALAVLTLLGTLIAFTQTRFWIITRWLLKRLLRQALELHDRNSPLNDLSQIEAMKRLLRGNQDIYHVSPLFGVASILNALVFLVLAAVVPYGLTGGSGPATVQALAAQGCKGLKTYSPLASQLANNFYQQCQVNSSVDAAACAYKTQTVPNNNPFRISLTSSCPFDGAAACGGLSSSWWKDLCHGPKPIVECEGGEDLDEYPQVLQIEHLGVYPSEFGLNVDGDVSFGHRLMCAVLPVYKLIVWEKEDAPHNSTVFWVGYPPSEINKTATWVSANESRVYTTKAEADAGRNPFIMGSGTVFDRVVYPVLHQPDPTRIYENFHQGLRNEEGDVFVVMFHYSVGVDNIPYYAGWREDSLKYGGDDLYNIFGSTTTALGCVEQFQLCSPDNCTVWGGISSARDGTQLEQQGLSGLEGLDAVQMILDATSFRYFLYQNQWQAMAVRDNLPRSLTSEPPPLPERQWHWEVKAWFSQVYLTVKYGLLVSSQGDGGDGYELANTSWICDKVLYLDDNYTNVDFIGLMATLASIAIVSLWTYTMSLIEAARKLVRLVHSAMWKQLRRWIAVLKGIMGLITPGMFAFPDSSGGPLGWPRAVWPAQIHTAPPAGVRHNGGYIDDVELPSLNQAAV